MLYYPLQEEMFKAKHAHFIGIGGIGMSAIARMLILRNIGVSGSDGSHSALIDELRELGAIVAIGHDASHIPNQSDLVVYTNALARDNVELVEAKQRGIKVLSYPEVLGEISRDKFTIAISGNAGKTTTTAMLGQILLDAGFDPTIIVGSLVNFTDKSGKTLRTNFISGKGKYLVVEADEYKRAFLNLAPEILAITNIEEDHLDYYKDFADIQDAFSALVNKISQKGFVVCAVEDKNVSPVLISLKGEKFDYPSLSLDGYTLPIPGEHNRSNARVAIAIANILNIDKEITKKSLENFKGAWRRFEYKGKTKKGVLIYDDYAHNPEKIKAVIAGTKEKFPNQRIVVIFQPHLFSRTKQMFNQFVESFSGVDRVIVMPIYASREALDTSINHNMLAKAMKISGKVSEVDSADSFTSAGGMLELEKEGTVCLVIGAGNIYLLSDKLV